RERSVAGAVHYRQVVADDQRIEVSVPIEISRVDAVRVSDRYRSLHAVERAVFLVDQNSDGRRIVIARDDVEIAVVVEVSRGDGSRIAADHISDPALKRPVAVSSTHLNA